MLELLFFILFMNANAVSNSEDINCTDQPYHNCLSRYPVPENVPNSEKSLNDNCPIVIKYTDCMWKYKETCGLEDTDFLPSREEYVRFSSLLQDICNSNSTLHSAIKNNIKCIADHLNGQSNSDCHAKSNSSIHSYLQSLPSEENENSTFGTYNPISCLRPAYDLACYVANVGEDCGSDAGDAALEVAGRLLYLQRLCSGWRMGDLRASLAFLDPLDRERFRRIFNFN